MCYVLLRFPTQRGNAAKKGLEIPTTLTREEAVGCLAAHVDADNFLPWLFSRKAFTGVISSEGFKITRVLRLRDTVPYTSSSSPVIVGAFRQDQAGITVMVRMRLHRFFAVFVCACLSTLLLESLHLGRSIFGMNFDSIPIFSVIMAFFIMLFWLHVRSQKLFLTGIFEDCCRRKQAASVSAVGGSQEPGRTAQ